MSQQVHYFVSMPFYPQNSVQPQCRTHSKPNLNIIFVLKIVTDAQVFETIRKYWGQGYLAAPYYLRYTLIGVVSFNRLTDLGNGKKRCDPELLPQVHLFMKNKSKDQDIIKNNS